MKKLISILCIFVLLVATSNLSVNIHFCGNAISAINFLGKNKTCGGTCDSKETLKEKSCCKNFTAVISTDDTSTSNFSFKTEQPAIAVVPIPFEFTTESNSSIEILKGSVVCNAPPINTSQPFYILYNSLII